MLSVVCVLGVACGCVVAWHVVVCGLWCAGSVAVGVGSIWRQSFPAFLYNALRIVRPSSLDAFAFGHLVLHLYAPMPNTRLPNIMKKYSNLIAYCKRE